MSFLQILWCRFRKCPRLYIHMFVNINQEFSVDKSAEKRPRDNSRLYVLLSVRTLSARRNRYNRSNTRRRGARSQQVFVQCWHRHVRLVYLRKQERVRRRDGVRHLSRVDRITFWSCFRVQWLNGCTYDRVRRLTICGSRGIYTSRNVASLMLTHPLTRCSDVLNAFVTSCDYTHRCDQTMDWAMTMMINDFIAVS